MHRGMSARISRLVSVLRSYGGPNNIDSIYVSFKGPCARHDLCIEFKQARERSYCDVKLRDDIKQNCRYFLRNATMWKDVRISRCYSTASLYYRVVKNQTSKYHDSGHWGNSGYSVWDTYRWDVWKQP